MAIPRLTRLAGALAALIIVAACSSAPRYRGHPSPVGTPSAPPVAVTPSPGDSAADGGSPALGDDVVKRAADYLGVPYRNGGTTAHGVDCSGLTYVVYSSFGVRLPRTSDDQARAGSPVSRDDLEPGDLIFFGSGSNISHVGIYAGAGEFIHASTRARSVRFDRLDNKYFRKRYITARRVL